MFFYANKNTQDTCKLKKGDIHIINRAGHRIDFGSSSFKLHWRWWWAFLLLWLFFKTYFLKGIHCFRYVLSLSEVSVFSAIQELLILVQPHVSVLAIVFFTMCYSLNYRVLAMSSASLLVSGLCGVSFSSAMCKLFWWCFTRSVQRGRVSKALFVSLLVLSVCFFDAFGFSTNYSARIITIGFTELESKSCSNLISRNKQPVFTCNILVGKNKLYFFS